jgi:biopolymer transport protein ExbD
MAELGTKKANEKKKRFNKKSTRVDLTPMVDLGFLLLTFFVFTTALSTPMAMKLVMPDDKIDTIKDPVCESCVLTVLLDKDNRIKYYEGAVENNPPIKETGFAPKEIRTVLMQKKASVERVRGSGNQFILIIKPSAASNFKNFVDITDEVTICQIKKYYVDEIRDADKKLLLNK